MAVIFSKADDIEEYIYDELLTSETYNLYRLTTGIESYKKPIGIIAVKAFSFEGAAKAMKKHIENDMMQIYDTEYTECNGITIDGPYDVESYSSVKRLIVSMETNEKIYVEEYLITVE